MMHCYGRRKVLFISSGQFFSMTCCNLVIREGQNQSFRQAATIHSFKIPRNIQDRLLWCQSRFYHRLLSIFLSSLFTYYLSTGWKRIASSASYKGKLAQTSGWKTSVVPTVPGAISAYLPHFSSDYCQSSVHRL